MSLLLSILLQSEYQYTLFVKSLPIRSAAWMYVLALPLCLGISVVYKSVKCDDFGRVPREAARLFVFILLVLALSAIALQGAVWLASR